VGQRRRRRQRRSFSVEETPIEVLEQLNMAWMSYQQAKNGPLTLFSDVIYASFASKGSFVTSTTFSPHVSGTIGATLAADYKYWIVEAGGTYEVASWNSHGGRYATPDTELELPGASPVRRRRVGRSLRRRTHPLPARARRGDRGARRRRRVRGGEQVHLAGARHLQLAGLHDGPMLIDGYVGWRALQVDYAQGAGVERYEFDVLQQGPVVGFTGRF
jgi:hypothetical protein